MLNSFVSRSAIYATQWPCLRVSGGGRRVPDYTVTVTIKCWQHERVRFAWPLICDPKQRSHRNVGRIPIAHLASVHFGILAWSWQRDRCEKTQVDWIGTQHLAYMPFKHLAWNG